MPDTEERQPRLTGERADHAVETSATTTVDLIADGATPHRPRRRSRMT